MDFKQPHRQVRRPQQGVVSSNHPPLTVPRPTVPAPSAHTPQPKPLVKRSSRWSSLRNVLFNKIPLVIAGGILLLVVAGLLLWHTFAKADHTSKDHASTPTYQTISPGGQSVSQLGGWRRVSPPNSQPVYAYDDSIGGVSISVSQQPLPSSFATNTDEKIAQLAKSYNATNKLATGDTTVYIGTSAKGPQSVIFTKNNLLVLIKSQSAVNDQAWKQYIIGLVRSGTSASPQY